MIEILKVRQVHALGSYKLHVTFSDGSAGVHDFHDVISETGPMIEPLRDPKLFDRVFISMGVLAWPNGFDLDAIQLHREMQSAGELTATAAE